MGSLPNTVLLQEVLGLLKHEYDDMMAASVG